MPTLLCLIINLAPRDRIKIIGIMKRILMSVIAVVLAVFTLQACKTSQTGVDPVAALNGEWNIIELNGALVVPAQEQSLPYLGFNPEDRRVYGSSGCNRIMGPYMLGSRNKLSFGKMGMTMMMCPDMTLEQEVLAMLDQVKSFKFQHDNLLFYGKGSKPIAVLGVKPQVEDLAQAAGVWDIEKVDGQPVGVSRKPFIEIDAEQKKITGNAGCNRMVGSIVTEKGVVRSMQFPNLAVTRMACSELELEGKVLKALGEASTFTISADGSLMTLSNEAGLEIMQLSKNIVED